jgi:hypothetical protein
MFPRNGERCHCRAAVVRSQRETWEAFEILLKVIKGNSENEEGSD